MSQVTKRGLFLLRTVSQGIVELRRRQEKAHADGSALRSHCDSAHLGSKDPLCRACQELAAVRARRRKPSMGGLRAANAAKP